MVRFLLLTLTILLCVAASQGFFRNKRHRWIKVICEHGPSGSLSCPYGRRIKVLHGFYGRQRKEICGKHVYTTSCVSKSSQSKIKKKCNNRRSCHLSARNEDYGDPCPGTNKYIEVKYKCIRFRRTFHKHRRYHYRRRRYYSKRHRYHSRRPRYLSRRSTRHSRRHRYRRHYYRGYF